MFEIAGRWVPDTQERRAKLTLDRCSAHAAWRAGQWEQHLPVLAGIDRQALIQPPNDAWRRCLEDLAALPSSPARLGGLYRVVLPRLAARYRDHLAVSSPSTEAPARRSLRLLLADVTTDRDEGDDALHSLLGQRSALELVAGAFVQLESAFLL
jgi:hypothetical protein